MPQEQNLSPEEYNAELLKKEQEVLEKNLFAKYNHVRLSVVERDHVEVYLDIVPESLNARGTVHGGAYFAMADACAGIVSRTDGRMYVTQTATVQYLRAATEGRLTAVGTVLHRGRTSCLVEIRIAEDSGKPVFMGTFLFHCIG
ncbi:MAG: PaaI family thioesterase [Lachnospiraceae bacterium]|nr:PaaI family thioesterase [Lachnospiraceae bacterium]